MNKYFIYLNWLQLLTLLGVVFHMRPLIGWSGVAGAVVGGMMTAGLVTWQYHRDGNPDREHNWLFGYFGKTYRLEIVIHSAAVVFFYLLSLLFLSGLWHFFCGMALMLLSNIIFECIWRYTFHLITIKKWVSKR